MKSLFNLLGNRCSKCGKKVKNPITIKSENHKVHKDEIICNECFNKQFNGSTNYRVKE